MSRPKHAVVFITTPEGWLPSRIHSLPTTIVAAEFHAQNLKLPDAIRIAKKFNKQHLAPHRFDGRWALVIKSLRVNRTWDPKVFAQEQAARQSAKPKGGAT